MTDDELTELERLSKELQDASNAYHAIPICSPCGKFVNTGPEVSEAACRELDAREAWERAIALHGHDLIAAVRARDAEIARLRAERIAGQ